MFSGQVPYGSKFATQVENEVLAGGRPKYIHSFQMQWLTWVFSPGFRHRGIAPKK